MSAPPPPGTGPFGPPPPPAIAAAPVPPQQLKPVIVLLLINLGLSIALTVVTVVARHSIVAYQLDYRHITDPAVRRALQDSYASAIIGRVVGNIVVSVVYVYLVRALLRGRRWAYRRVIWIGAAGIVGLLLLQFVPYPPWMRAEQIVQALVLALLLYFVRRPEVHAHFAGDPAGRRTSRFRR